MAVVRLFFMQKFKHKEVVAMFDVNFLEKILSNEECHKIPFGSQATMIHVFEEVLTEIKEEDPDATISTLLNE